MPAVTILYFATLRERRGVSSETLDVPEGTTLGGLYAELFPAGPDGVLPVGYARNEAQADADTVVAHGDEIAFLPPIGGG